MEAPPPAPPRRARSVSARSWREALHGPLKAALEAEPETSDSPAQLQAVKRGSAPRTAESPSDSEGASDASGGRSHGRCWETVFFFFSFFFFLNVYMFASCGLVVEIPTIYFAAPLPPEQRYMRPNWWGVQKFGPESQFDLMPIKGFFF